MAERVHFLGKPFNFEHIDLSTPNGLQGGSYFTKLTHNNEPLYVQTPKCGTRQGIVINGKKAHYDILLDSTSNTPGESERTAFIGWLERVEERVVQLLHSKGSVWFTNELSIEDIQSLFTSPIKSSRGGAQFLIRANIAPSKTNPGQFACSVYDEHETQTNLEYISPDHAVISIIEVTGVRFTSRSFQLELACKQMAVLANKPIFETCIINKNVQPWPLPSMSVIPASPVEPTSVPVPRAPAPAPVPAKPIFGLTEIDVGVSETNPQSIHIKSPVEVYYAMYRAAIKRAREAKKIAIESYLDAKNIKNVYKLNLVDDDDDEDDDSDADADADADNADADADADAGGDNQDDEDDNDNSEDDEECEDATINANIDNPNIKKSKLAIHDDDNSISLNIGYEMIVL
jgi:hypothetical protein